MRLQGTEVETDPFQRGGVQGLVAKENHQVRSQRIVQVLKLGIIQRLRQVDTRYDCPDPGCQRGYLNSLVSHDVAFVNSWYTRPGLVIEIKPVMIINNIINKVLSFHARIR